MTRPDRGEQPEKGTVRGRAMIGAEPDHRSDDYRFNLTLRAPWPERGLKWLVRVGCGCCWRDAGGCGKCTMREIQYDKLIIETFIRPAERDRCYWMLDHPRRGTRATHGTYGQMLYDVNNINPQCLEELPGRPYPQQFYNLLKARGAEDQCYVVSASLELDGTLMTLQAALEACAGSGVATIIYPLIGNVGYYETDGARYVLLKTPG